MSRAREHFLPVSRDDMRERDWYYYDFLLITGDAYVDHPSFGTAVISRVLEKAGFRVAILAQPDWRNPESVTVLGKPRLGVLINSGNIDSMVAHFTAAKKRRSADSYTPGGKAGARPDRAVIVYSNLARRAFPDTPILIGGLEASLRRFAHYDYWDDKVRRSILLDSGADILSYGMGETAMVEMARRLKRGSGVEGLRDIRGIAFAAKSYEDCAFPDALEVPAFEDVSTDKRAYAKAAFLQQNENDPFRGRALLQRDGGRWLIQNPPALPLEGDALDAVYALPYARDYHPDYEASGGIAAIEEVKFSIIHNRGCFGSCNFCALSMHQGRYVSSRSHASVLREAELIIQDPDFKGYIHDVGGPTANFRRPACKKQKKVGTCTDRQCLFPTPCPSLDADEGDYLALLTKLRTLPGVKKVFVRSGIRFDYMLADQKSHFFQELVRHHVSGQLKVAPEHISPEVLHHMGKPFADVYDKFCERYYDLSRRAGKEQYLVPYLMSSHPGSRLDDAIALAQYLKAHKLTPQQVQDFYPTPGSLSTAMYYTGLDPRTLEPVFVPRTPEEKQMQWALLRYRDPKHRGTVIKALRQAGRDDLIGHGPHCLAAGSATPKNAKTETKGTSKPPAKSQGQRPASRGKAADEGKPTGKKRGPKGK